MRMPQNVPEERTCLSNAHKIAQQVLFLAFHMSQWCCVMGLTGTIIPLLSVAVHIDYAGSVH